MTKLIDRSSPTSALVIGASGLVGSAVARRLVDEGFRVTATIRSPTAAVWAGNALEGARIAMLPDVLNNEAVAAVLMKSDAEVVISCCGVMSASGPGAARALVDGNVTAMAVILDACTRATLGRAVVFGSGFEYAPEGGPIDEMGATGPTTLYGASKRAGSTLAQYFRDGFGLDVCIARPFSLYGPRERLHRFVPGVIAAALTERDIEMSHGMQTRDYLHVDDLADGVVRMARHVGQLPPVLNFAGAQTHRLQDIATTVVELTGSGTLVRTGARPPNPSDRRVFLGDTSLAAEALEWHPAYDLRSGLAATVDWYRSNRKLWEGTQ